MDDKFVSMVHDFLENSEEYVTKAESAFTIGDAQSLAGFVHPLKSSSASLGMIRIAELAEHIEQEANIIHQSNQDDVSSLSQSIKDMRQSFEDSKAILTEYISNTTL